MHRKYVPHRNEERPARAMNAVWLLRLHGYGSQMDVLHSLSGGICKHNSLSSLFYVSQLMIYNGFSELQVN